MQSYVNIKPLRIGVITLAFTLISKSCPVRDFLRRQCAFFNVIGENKILAKISEFTV